jgi:hypothetical protein
VAANSARHLAAARGRPRVHSSVDGLRRVEPSAACWRLALVAPPCFHQEMYRATVQALVQGPPPPSDTAAARTGAAGRARPRPARAPVVPQPLLVCPGQVSPCYPEGRSHRHTFAAAGCPCCPSQHWLGAGCTSGTSAPCAPVPRALPAESPVTPMVIVATWPHLPSSWHQVCGAPQLNAAYDYAPVRGWGTVTDGPDTTLVSRRPVAHIAP